MDREGNKGFSISMLSYITSVKEHVQLKIKLRSERNGGKAKAKALVKRKPSQEGTEGTTFGAML